VESYSVYYQYMRAEKFTVDSAIRLSHITFGFSQAGDGRVLR